MAAGWSADETRALLGIWGDADVQSKPHESSGPLPLSPLPRAFPSPLTISARLGHEQIEQEYHERSLASIAFRAREMPGSANTLSCDYHVRIMSTRSMRARRADAIYQDRIRLLVMRIQGAPQCASSADMP